MIHQQVVHEILAAWRDAERQLELTEDPDAIAELEARIARLRDEYRTAVANAAVGLTGAEIDPS